MLGLKIFFKLFMFIIYTKNIILIIVVEILNTTIIPVDHITLSSINCRNDNKLDAGAIISMY